MSFVQVASDLLRSGVPSDELHVYLILCDYAGKKSVCWPSDRTIGTLIGRSQGTVSRIMGRLEARGLISRTKVETNDENPTGRVIITNQRVASTAGQPLPQKRGTPALQRPRHPASIPMHDPEKEKNQYRPRGADEPPDDQKPLTQPEITRMFREMIRRP